jgi:signal transduction histidine kinase
MSTGIYQDPNRRAEVLEELRSKGAVQAATVLFKKKNGDVINVSLSGRLCSDANGSQMLFEGFMEDVTERKKLEDQLRQSQKMDAIGRLAGGIAHDFNNMLTAVIGYADLLSAMPGLNERQGKHVVQISKAAHRAASLTQQLLAFSRQQVLQPTPMDINTAIEDTLAMINRLLGEHIIVSFEAGPDVPLVFVDASQVTQILMNLCLNARDAMPQGGFLRITTQAETIGQNAGNQNPELKPGSYVRISIADTGAGMTPEVQAKIFEPFFTTKGLGKGTGLGLATVYGLVQQSGGHIAVLSQVGVGTCFNIYLPAAKVGTHVADDDGEQQEFGSSGLSKVANGV